MVVRVLKNSAGNEEETKEKDKGVYIVDPKLEQYLFVVVVLQ